jgi:hypothetical protein
MSKYISAVLAAVVLFPALAFAQVPPPIVINTTALPDTAYGTSVSDPISTSGGVAPFTWSASGLPTGVSINPSTGVISGTPATQITYDSSGHPVQAGTRTLNIAVHIQDAVGQVTDATLPWNIYSSFSYARTPAGNGPFAFGVPITAHIVGKYGADFCVGQSGGYQLKMYYGTDPAAGLSAFISHSFTHSQGDVVDDTWSAVPAKNTYVVAIMLACGSEYMMEEPTIAIAGLPTITTGSLLAPGTVGQAYSTTLQTSGSVAPYTWSVISGALPAGLSLNSSTGVISGTPTAVASPATFTVQVQDTGGNSASKAFTLYVFAPLGYTAAGTSVSVTPATTDGSGNPISPSPGSLTFSNVTSSGISSTQITSSGSTPPAGFRIGSPATYYNISTTATFTGSVLVCIDYTGVSYQNEASIKLMHYDSTTGRWTNVTTSLNTTTNIVCGLTSSFSQFAVMEQKTPLELLTDLRDTVYALDLAKGITTSLDAKLNAAEQAISDVNQNDNVAAHNALEAFISAVNTQLNNGTLTSAEANDLIARAHEIEAVL